MMTFGRQLHAFADHLQEQEPRAKFQNGHRHTALVEAGYPLRELADDADQCPEFYGPAKPMHIDAARDLFLDSLECEAMKATPERAQLLRRVAGNVRKV